MTESHYEDVIQKSLERFRVLHQQPEEIDVEHLGHHPRVTLLEPTEGFLLKGKEHRPGQFVIASCAWGRKTEATASLAVCL